MTIKVSKPAKGLREAITEIIGRGASVINGMTKGDAQDELEVSRKNWIINGDMQVSQRGDYTSATATNHGSYRLDRWADHRSGVASDIQDTGGAVKYIATSTGTGSLGGYQVVEDYGQFAGVTTTISVRVKSNNVNGRIIVNIGSVIATVATNGSGEWEDISLTFTPSSGISLLYFQFIIASSTGTNVSITSGDYIEFTNVKLEIGDTATPFESRSYAEELALCQRYYYKWDASSHSYLNICMGIAVNSTKSRGVVDYPVTMRNTPSINSSGSFRSVDTAANTGVTVSISRASKFNTYINFDGTSGDNLTGGAATEMGADNDTSAWIAFDAEL